MIKKNKEYFINKLMEYTSKDEKTCSIINDILENNNLIGHNNKEKIINDFVKKLQITELEANKLYNICAEIIVKGIFN